MGYESYFVLLTVWLLAGCGGFGAAIDPEEQALLDKNRYVDCMTYGQSLIELRYRDFKEAQQEHKERENQKVRVLELDRRARQYLTEHNLNVKDMLAPPPLLTTEQIADLQPIAFPTWAKVRTDFRKWLQEECTSERQRLNGHYSP